MPEKFGQHFLKDKTIARRIISLLPEGGRVLEIGPGKGVLTAGLSEIADELLCVEKDAALARYIKEKFGGKKVRVVTGNILKESNFFVRPGAGGYTGPKTADAPPFNIISNLPYSISTDMIYFLAGLSAWDICVLTVQKEAAERFLAPAGSSNYGAASVTAEVFFDARIEFIFSKKSFSPPPKVDAAVMVMKNKRVRADIKVWKKFLHGCFFSRRKTLANNLKRFIGVEKANALLESSGINPLIRPQGVGPGQYLKLFEKIFSPENISPGMSG